MSHRPAHRPRQIRSHPGTNLGGLVLLALALATAVGVGIAALAFGRPILWRVETVAGVLLLVGLWSRFTGQRLALDWSQRQLTVRGERLAFNDIAHIELRAATVEKTTAQGTHQLTRYQVHLIRAADRDLVARVADVRRKLDAAVVDGRAPMSTAEHVSLAAEVERLRPARATDAILAFDHPDELRLWRVAESLAKALDLPVIDFAGDTVVIRTPAELDLPLGTRLARLHVALPDPGAAPAGLQELRAPDGVRFLWRFNVWAPVIGLALITALLAGAGLVTWADLWEVRLGFAAMAAVLALWALRLGLGARRSLTLGRAFVSYRPGLWPRRALRLPIAELELVRVSRAHPDTVGLVSDRRLVRVRLPSASADWLRRRLEFLLREQVG